jgi:hypothetical protein
LYSDENSQIADLGRPQGNYDISSSVSIIAEIVLTDNNLFIFDPPIVGTTDDSIYYTYSASNAPSEIIVTSYPLSSRYFSDGGKED